MKSRKSWIIFFVLLLSIHGLIFLVSSSTASMVIGGSQDETERVDWCALFEYPSCAFEQVSANSFELTWNSLTPSVVEGMLEQLQTLKGWQLYGFQVAPHSTGQQLTLKVQMIAVQN